MNERSQWATRMLATALPSPLQTAALDVCINADDRAFHNWRSHIGVGADARRLMGTGDSRLRRLVSLLYMRFRDTDIVLEKSLLTWFRTGAARERFRSESVDEISGMALGSLAEAGVTPIVVNGVAMANTVYPEKHARHCHDLDLLLSSPDIPIALAALGRAGLSPSAPRAHASASTVWLSHSSGFVVALHRVPYRVREWNSDADTVHARAVSATVAGRNVRVFGDEDAVVRVVCNGLSAGSRHSPGWAVDAALLINARRETLKWDQVVAVAKPCNRTAAVLVGLNYLKQALRVEIPERVLHDLSAAASSDMGTAATLEAARLSCYGSRLGLIRRSRRADIVRTTAWSLAARAERT